MLEGQVKIGIIPNRIGSRCELCASFINRIISGIFAGFSFCINSNTFFIFGQSEAKSGGEKITTNSDYLLEFLLTCGPSVTHEEFGVVSHSGSHMPTVRNDHRAGLRRRGNPPVLDMPAT